MSGFRTLSWPLCGLQVASAPKAPQALPEPNSDSLTECGVVVSEIGTGRSVNKIVNLWLTCFRFLRKVDGFGSNSMVKSMGVMRLVERLKHG